MAGFQPVAPDARAAFMQATQAMQSTGPNEKGGFLCETGGV